MSYPIGTTLRKKEPFTDDSGNAHLNFVRVVAQSPVKGVSLGEWASANGESVVVTPAEGFGPNETLPISIGQAQYEIEFMPEEPPDTVITERQVPQGRLRAQSPEEVFERQRIAARAAAEAEQQAVVVKVDENKGKTGGRA